MKNILCLNDKGLAQKLQSHSSKSETLKFIYLSIAC